MSNTISFNCPNCSTRLNVPAELAGVTGPCPYCHVTISAPTASPAQPAPEYSSPVTAVSPEPVPYAAPAEALTVPSQAVEPNPPNTDYAYETESAISSASQSSRGWRQPLNYALIGFISVVALAAATWGIAKAIEKSKERQTDDISLPSERMEPQASPMNTDISDEPSRDITKDGKVREGDTVFPIFNTVEPPAIKAGSTAGLPFDELITSPDIIDQRRDELNSLLSDNPAPSAPQGNSERMMTECHKLISDFFAAKTLEERLPMIFSERIPAGELAETFANTILDSPIIIAKAINSSSIIHLGYEGPNAEGITQQYFNVTLAGSEDGKTPTRNIIIHMANHLEGKYRINADAFLFSSETKLEEFVNNPEADPLIAYFFLERCHFDIKTGTKEPKSGIFIVRLLNTPFDPPANTAYVDAISKAGAILNPLVKWGVPPRAAIVELKHEIDASGNNAIYIDRVLNTNWLQSYEATTRDKE